MRFRFTGAAGFGWVCLLVFGWSAEQSLAQQETLLGPASYVVSTNVELDVQERPFMPARTSVEVRGYRSTQPGASLIERVAPQPIREARAIADAGNLPGRLTTLAEVSGGISRRAIDPNPFMRATALSSVTRFWRFDSTDPTVTQAELRFDYLLSGALTLQGIGVRGSPGVATTRYRLELLDEDFNVTQTPIRVELRLVNPASEVQLLSNFNDFFFVETFGSLADADSIRAAARVVDPIFEGLLLLGPAEAEIRTLQRSTDTILLPLDTPIGFRWTLESEAELVHNLNIAPQTIFDSLVSSNFARTLYLDTDELDDSISISESGFGFSLAGDSVGVVSFAEILVVPEPGSAALLTLTAAAGLLRRRRA